MSLYLFSILINLLSAFLIGFVHSSVSKDPEIVDRTSIENLIKNRNGKILVLNVWATWCIPCREEIPEFNELYKNYSKKNVEVVGLCIDSPKDLETKIKSFIKKIPIKFPVIVSGIKKDEELINLLEQKWAGAIPVTIIYDKKGKKVKFIEGKTSYKELENIIKSIK